MTPEYLKKVLPLFLHVGFAEATNARLLSLARAYTALCTLATFDAPAGEYATRQIWLQKINTLFGVLRQRCCEESDIAMRCRMVHAMYGLVCGAMWGDVSKKKAVCFALSDQLVRDYTGGREERAVPTREPELSAETGLCNCLIDLLYPCPDADDEYLLLLKRLIAGWVARMNPDGSWREVSADIALERITVMSRNSYLLLDKTDDTAIGRSFEYYRRSLPIPEDAGNVAENYCYTLGRLCDAALHASGHDADRSAVRQIGRLMCDYSRIAACTEDDRLYSASYVARCAAEAIADRIQTRYLLDIA